MEATKGMLTTEQIRAMQKAHSKKIDEIMPGLIDQVKAENPDVVNEDHIREIAMSMAILKAGVYASDNWGGEIECLRPSSTSGKPQGNGSQTQTTYTLEDLEKDFPPIGETPSESD